MTEAAVIMTVLVETKPLRNLCWAGPLMSPCDIETTSDNTDCKRVNCEPTVNE